MSASWISTFSRGVGRIRRQASRSARLDHDAPWPKSQAACSPNAMTTQRVSEVVKPALLRWTRETAGLAPDQAAKKIGVKPERLAEWEKGRLRPTVAQLRKAAHVYRRPLAVFFLATPPAQPAALHDFRRLPGGAPLRLSSELLFEMRRARRRRAVALDLLPELDRPIPEFPLRAALDHDAEDVATQARAWLHVGLEEQARWTNEYIR